MGKYHADPSVDTALKVLAARITASELDKIIADIAAGFATVRLEDEFVLVTTERKDRG